MKIIGKWWANKNIDLLEYEGKVYALNGWNGHEYGNCWMCEGEYNLEAGEESYTITPEIGEYLEDEENDCYTWDVIDYVITKN